MRLINGEALPCLTGGPTIHGWPPLETGDATVGWLSISNGLRVPGVGVSVLPRLGGETPLAHGCRAVWQCSPDPGYC